MPHLRLEVPQEWLAEEFTRSTGFDAKKLLDHLIEVVAEMRMPNAALEARRQELGAFATGDEIRTADNGTTIPEMVPLINKSNLKHAIVPLYYAHMQGDPSKRFLHVTLAAGNDTPGRTAEVRLAAAHRLGDEIDAFVSGMPKIVEAVGSVTAWVQDINRDRGYSTTGERKKRRQQQTA